MRRSLYANEATLIEYEGSTNLLWWDGVPIGRLLDSSLAVETVESAVKRLHEADIEAMTARTERLVREANHA